MDQTPDAKRKPSWATLSVLTLVVAGVAAFVLSRGSATPSPSAFPSPSLSPSPSASPSPTPTPVVLQKGKITLTVPAKILGLARDRNRPGAAAWQVKKWIPFSDATKMLASYGKAGSNDGFSFVAAKTKRLGKPAVEANALMDRIFSCIKTCTKLAIEPGSLGGAALCAAFETKHSRVPGVMLCTWADEGSLGFVTFAGWVTVENAKTKFVKVREAIERKGSR